MSQLLTEALQDVRWTEEQLEAAETALLARNRTQQPCLPPWAPASLFMHWSWSKSESRGNGVAKGMCKVAPNTTLLEDRRGNQTRTPQQN